MRKKYQEVLLKTNMDQNLDIKHQDILPGFTDKKAMDVKIK